jgi:hypothetical protein
MPERKEKICGEEERTKGAGENERSIICIIAARAEKILSHQISLLLER